MVLDRERLLQLARMEAETASQPPGPAGPPQEEDQQSEEDFDMLQHARQVRESYELKAKLNSGTYGIVYLARDKRSNKDTALKMLRLNEKSMRDGYPVTALREMSILQVVQHPNIIKVKEVVCEYHSTSTKSNLPRDVYMALEFQDHDLGKLLKERHVKFEVPEVKCLMQQLLRGVQYLHENWIMHRDIKTSNLLYNNRGELKICDFGLAREYSEPLTPYTQPVVTMYYRAPELLLSNNDKGYVYGPAIDMWSVGAVFYEMITGKVLFESKTNKEYEHLKVICSILGDINEVRMPGVLSMPFCKTMRLPSGNTGEGGKPR